MRPNVTTTGPLGEYHIRVAASQQQVRAFISIPGPRRLDAQHAVDHSFVCEGEPLPVSLPLSLCLYLSLSLYISLALSHLNP